MSSPFDRIVRESSPSARTSDRGSPHSDRRDSPLSERLDSLAGERRSLIRTEKRTKGQHSASVVVGSVRIKAEFDDFSYGDACSVSPKVLAERKKYRTDVTGSHVKEEPTETGILFGDVESSETELHTPLPTSAYQLTQLTGHESVGNLGMWSHKKFGIGGFVQYGPGLMRSGTMQSDSPGLSKSVYPRIDAPGSVRGGLSIDGSPDSGNSTESRKSGSFPYGSPKMVVKSEKSPSPKCDIATTRSTPAQSPDQILPTHSWLHMNRSKSCSPENRSLIEMSPQRFVTRKENSRVQHSIPSPIDLELTSIYPCKFCHEAFSLYTALQEHVRLEHSDDPVVNSKSLDFGKVHRPAISHSHTQDARPSSSYSEGSDGNKYTCKFCSSGFEFYTVLQEHVRIAHDGGRRSSSNSTTSTRLPCSVSPVVADGPGKYPCKHCDESFPLYTALQEHIRIEHGENAYWGRAAYMSMMIDGKEEFLEEMMNRCDCQFCPEKFSTPALLQEHVQVEHVPKWSAQKKAMSQPLPVVNSNSNDQAVSVKNSPPAELVNQDAIKNLLKKYVCSICGKEYANKLRYQVHCKSHSKEREVEKVEPKVEPPPKPPAEPPASIVPFPTNSETTSVNIEDLRYVCEVCNARFPLYVVMQEHIRTAHGDKPFKCDLCEKEFIKRNYLMKHMKAHAEAKAQVLKCQRCDRCFMDQARLQEHAKEHSNEGRYKCQVCGSCFTHKMHHDQHVRTHSGEKPYKCGECGKQFSQPGPFHNHLRSHARCAYCNRTFLEKAALLLHLKTEHGQKIAEPDTNRASPVSIGSAIRNQGLGLVPSSLIPVRLPETEYLATSPNEPLNLSKNSKESPLRVTPVSFQTGSHLMSPVVFPGMELYADLMSSLGGGAAMSITSSNSNTSSLNDTSRPSSAKSDTVSEMRLSKSDLRDQRRSPVSGKEREQVSKFMKDSSKMPFLEHRIEGASRERSDLNGADKFYHGPLSIDFLSTSSGYTSTNSKQPVVSKSSGNVTRNNSSLKYEAMETQMAKSRELSDKLLCKSPQLENLFVKTFHSEHMMEYGMRMHQELLHNSPNLSSELSAPLRTSPCEKRRYIGENEKPWGTDLKDSCPTSKMMKLEKTNDSDIDVDSASEDNLTIATDGDEDFIDADGTDGDGGIQNDNVEKTDDEHYDSSNDSYLDDYLSYVCGICTEVFPSAEEMEGHVCQGKPDEQDGAGEILHNNKHDTAISPSASETDGASHTRITDGKQVHVYRCKSCSKVFWKKSHLLQHLEIHDEFAKKNEILTNRGQRFSCDLCEKSFTSSNELYGHLHNHTGVRHHECPVCSRMFILKCHLVAHMSVHSEERQHRCEECGKSYRLRTLLLEHIKIHSSDYFTCDLCGRSFTLIGQLQKHMNIHATVKLFSCKFCDKSFARNGQLQQHVCIQTNSRPHECDVCKKSFTCSQALQQHVRIHTVDKPYKCCYCGKGFSQNSLLHEHLRKHNEERPYSCNDCDSSFDRKDQLRKHVKIHVEKPFQCGRCRERFSVTASLQVHVDSDACRNLYTCQVCQKSFAMNSQLKCHLKTHERLGEGRNDLKRGGGGGHDQSMSENDGFDNASFTDVCDTSDNLENSPENATTMTANTFSLPLPDGVDVDGSEGGFHVKREAVALE